MPDGKVPPVEIERVVFAATPMAVRRVLGDLNHRLRAAGVTQDTCETAQQVLAEVLNNVVEHALAGCGDRRIRLATLLIPGALRCEVHDNGRTMPGGKLPAGHPACLDRDMQDLPEGGFGWFLIRSLTQGLNYHRKDGWNCLSFEVPTAAEDSEATAH